MYGSLPPAGIGVARQCGSVASMEVLRGTCRGNNEELIRKLRPDSCEAELHRLALIVCATVRAHVPNGAVGAEVDS